MSKPILGIEIKTLDEKSTRVRAVFDTGAYPTIVREDRLPRGAVVLRGPTVRQMRTAAQGEKLAIAGGSILVMTIGDRVIRDEALVSPNLAQDMLVGAGTMQKWDISIHNENGHTSVAVGRDLRDPDIQEID